MKSPVLFIVFCRPDTTARVFEAIKNARPPRLYIAADAPRENIKGESERCNQVRNLFEHIDWPCEVYKLFQEKNLGCSLGPYEAISWFFKHEEEGIILEDDIVPIPDFFKYCDEMLELYRNNLKIQAVSGWSYFYNGFPESYQYSYYFSNITSSWGWATWRRVWDEMDLKLKTVSRDTILSYLISLKFPKLTIRLYMYYFDKIANKFDILQSWDYQFLFSMWKHERYVIQPLTSMTHNIGYDEGATHKFEKSISLHSTKTIYPIKHPTVIKDSLELDLIRIKEENLYWHSWLGWKFIGLKRKIKKLFK